MSEDDLSDDLQHIMDDLDDDLFGKKKKPDLGDPLERRRDLAPQPVSSPPKGNGKKVKFEETGKDEGAGKTFNKKLDRKFDYQALTLVFIGLRFIFCVIFIPSAFFTILVIINVFPFLKYLL